METLPSGAGSCGGGEGGEGQVADIKSNNPHLTGGEKMNYENAPANQLKSS